MAERWVLRLGLPAGYQLLDRYVHIVNDEHGAHLTATVALEGTVPPLLNEAPFITHFVPAVRTVTGAYLLQPAAPAMWVPGPIPDPPLMSGNYPQLSQAVATSIAAASSIIGSSPPVDAVLSIAAFGYAGSSYAVTGRYDSAAARAN